MSDIGQFDPNRGDVPKPSKKRLGRAATVVIAIIVAIIVVIVIGMNISHKDEVDQERSTGVLQRSGGLN